MEIQFSADLIFFRRFDLILGALRSFFFNTRKLVIRIEPRIFQKSIQPNIKIMANNKNKKRARKRFTSVDPFQKEFGQISVRAVYDVFAQKFGIETKDMKDYSFSHCVNALRKLEDPNLVAAPTDQSSY